MTTSGSDGPAPVVDLEDLRAACGPVVALYRRFLDSGGRQLDMDELDDALAEMRRLPPISGRMGRALALVASGGAEATTEDVIAALDLLSDAPGLRPAIEAAAPPPRPRVGPPTQGAQPVLPGLD